MDSLRTILKDQARTLAVLGAIAAVMLVGCIWKADWPAIFGGVGIVAEGDDMPFDIGRPDDQAADVLPGTSPDDGASSLSPKAEAIAPDYHLPDTSGAEIPVLTRVPTERPVVFLTIDDGMVRSEEAMRLLRRHSIKAPMFLNDIYVKDNPAYFRALAKQGMVAGSHTSTHADLTTLGYDDQLQEICTNAANLESWLGRRPTLFRPPYGSYDANTVRAASDCGMRAVVMWSAKANGGSMQYQDGRTGLVKGDIVLMHFRPEFQRDLQAFLDAAEAAGLQPVNLSDWLRPARHLPSADV